LDSKLENLYIIGGRDFNAYEEHHQILQFNLAANVLKVDGIFERGLAQGSTASDSAGNLYYFGGSRFGVALDSVWRIELTQNSEPKVPIEVAKMPRASRNHCTVSDGKHSFYLIGGELANGGGTFDDILVFDTVTNKFSTVATLPTPLVGHACALFGDSIFIFGGDNRDFYPNSILKFHIPTAQVTELDIGLSRENIYEATALTVADAIYLVGGLSFTADDQPITHHVTRYDPITGNQEYLEIVGRRTFARSGIIYHPPSHQIYVAGGTSHNEYGDLVQLNEIFAIQL